MFISKTQLHIPYAKTAQMSVMYPGNYFPYFESVMAESIRQRTTMPEPLFKQPEPYFN